MDINNTRFLTMKKNKNRFCTIELAKGSWTHPKCTCTMNFRKCAIDGLNRTQSLAGVISLSEGLLLHHQIILLIFLFPLQ